MPIGIIISCFAAHSYVLIKINIEIFRSDTITVVVIIPNFRNSNAIICNVSIGKDDFHCIATYNTLDSIIDQFNRFIILSDTPEQISILIRKLSDSVMCSTLGQTLNRNRCAISIQHQLSYACPMTIIFSHRHFDFQRFVINLEYASINRMIFCYGFSALIPGKDFAPCVQTNGEIGLIVDFAKNVFANRHAAFFCRILEDNTINGICSRSIVGRGVFKNR